MSALSASAVDSWSRDETDWGCKIHRFNFYTVSGEVCSVRSRKRNAGTVERKIVLHKM